MALGELLIEIGLKNFGKTLSDIKSLGGVIASVPPLKIPTPDVAGKIKESIAKIPNLIPLKTVVNTAGINDAATIFAKLKEKFSTTPLQMRVKLQSEMADFFSGLRKDLSALKPSLRVAIVTEKIAEVDRQIKELTNRPRTAVIQAQLADLENIKRKLESLKPPRLTVQAVLAATQANLFESIKKQFGSPLVARVALQSQMADYLSKLKAELAGLKPSVKVAVLADKIGEVNKQIAELAAKPRTALVKAQLADFEALKKQLASLKPGKVEVQAVMSAAQANLFDKIKKQFDVGSLTAKVRLQAEMSDYFTKLHESLAKQPPSVRVAVVAERLSIVDKQIAELSAKPRTAVIQARLDALGDVRKQLGSLTLPNVLDAGKDKGGFSLLRDNMKKLQDGLKPLLDGIDAIGKTATRTFGVASAALLGFVRVASPGHFQLFTDSLTVLSKEIGFIFIPLIKQVTLAVVNLAGYFHNLDDAGRTNLLGWVKFGLVLTGMVALVPKLIGGFRLVVGGFSAMLAAINFLLISNPAGWFGVVIVSAVAVVAAIAGLAAMFVVIGQKGDTFGEKMASLWRGIKAVWESLQPSINAVVAVFRQAYVVIETGVQVLLEVWKEFGVDFSGIFKGMQEVFVGVMDTLSIVLKNGAAGLITFGVISKNVVKAFMDTWKAVWDFLRPYWENVTRLFAVAWNNIMGGFENLTNFILSGLKKIIEGFYTAAEIAARVGEAIRTQTQVIAIRANFDPAGLAKDIATGKLAVDVVKSVNLDGVSDKVKDKMKSWEPIFEQGAKNLNTAMQSAFRGIQLPKLMDFLPDDWKDEIKARIESFNKAFEKAKVEEKKGDTKRGKQFQELPPRNAGQLISVTEAYRRIQAAQNDPTFESMKKQEGLLTSIDEKLRTIATNTGSQIVVGALA